jgi:hypothetical protein
VPSVAEYMHIGDTATRLGIVSARRRNGVNIGGTARSGTPLCAAIARSTPAMYAGSRSRWLAWPTRWLPVNSENTNCCGGRST